MKLIRGRLCSGVIMLSLASPLFCSCRSPMTLDGGLRDAIGRQFARELNSAGGTIRILAANNLQHALCLFDAYIAPTLEDRSDARLNSLRHRLEDGKSWIYYYEIDGRYLCCHFVDLFPSCNSGQYGFNYYNSAWDYEQGKLERLVESRGVLGLQPKDPSLGFRYSDSDYEEYCAGVPRFKCGLYGPTGNDSQLVSGSADIWMIADVVDVQLVGVTGFDYSRTHDLSYPGCCAEYRVRLDVRKVERGELSSKICILEVRPFWEEFMFDGSWCFYRGMTLRVGLYREKGTTYCVEAEPVEPYPPYSNENVRVCGGSLVGGIDAMENGRLKPLVVEYGAHTKVEFKHGDIITSGKRATFADFGVTSKLKILEMKEGANRSYWENAWFNQEE